MGRSTSYTLRYDYAEAPDVLAWKLVEGDIMRKLDGSYVLAAGRRRPRQHRRSTYHLEVDLLVPAARLRQAPGRGPHHATALRSLRAHLET